MACSFPLSLHLQRRPVCASHIPLFGRHVTASGQKSKTSSRAQAAKNMSRATLKSESFGCAIDLGGSRFRLHLALHREVQTTPLLRACLTQEPQVLVTLLPSNEADVEHDSIAEGGGNLRCTQEMPVCTPTRHPGMGEASTRKTNQELRCCVSPVSIVDEGKHRVALICIYKH